MHRAPVEDACGDTIAGRASRDSTAIEARGKPKAEGRPKRRRGRPKKGEERPTEPSRRERRPAGEMAAELPAACDVGARHNAKGHLVSWTGYKLHIEAADGGIRAGCPLTSATLHEKQATIPLAAATGERVDHLCELMDSACDAAEIKDCSQRF